MHRGSYLAKRKILLISAIVALVAIATAVTLFTTLADITATQTVSSSGGISTSANLVVYADNACTTPLNTINWGSPAPGSVISQTIYVKNTSNGLSLTLNMTTSGWSPTNANVPITITWNQEGTRLQPGASTAATLTLSVSPNIVDITTFSVQICITGTN